MLSLMKNEFIKITWKKKSVFLMIAFILLLFLIAVSSYKSYGEFNAFNFIKIVINEVLGSFLLAIAIVLFSSDIVSGEFTPPTLKLLLVQPVSKGKILLSKFLTSTIYSLVFIYLVEFIFFIIIGCISGFGNANYPVFIGTIYKLNPLISHESNLLIEVANSTKMIPIWQNTIYLLLHQGLFIVSCSAFSLLISVVFKNNVGSLIFGVLFIVVTSILTVLFSPLEKFSHLFFFTYGPSGDLLNGQLATMNANPSITIGNSIVCLVIWTIACYLISYIIFTKEDILI